MYDKNDLELMKHGQRYEELAKEHSKAQIDYATSEGILEVLAAKCSEGICDMTGKKFIGTDSIIRTLLQYSYTEDGSGIAQKVSNYHQILRQSKGKIEGLKGEMKAIQAQIDLLRSKLSYEKAQTTN